MASSWASLFPRTDLQIGVEGDDSRIGSARDGGSGGTLSANSNEKSSSLQSLSATLIPVVIYAGCCLLFFCCFRRKCGRVYAPRTIPSLRSPHPVTPLLPDGWLNWVVPFFKIPDTFVLSHSSLDGFFFLRYLRVLRNIFLVGICIAWPTLFTVHITSHSDVKQLDILTIGDIEDPRRMWAHAVVAWLFFSSVLFTISRECIYYIGVRQAFLSSPHYAERPSSRTLLVTSIPERYLDEARMQRLYGDSVKRVWIPRTSKALIKLVEEREQTALRLEQAEIALIKKANMARKKQMKAQPPTASSPSTKPCAAPSDCPIRTETDSRQRRSSGPRVEIAEDDKTQKENGHDECFRSNPAQAPQVDTHDLLEKAAEDPEYVPPYGLNTGLPDVRGSVAAQWIPVTARPHHRPLHNFFRRVDTIRWCRTRLEELNLEVSKLRRQVRRGDGQTLPAAFIEFDTQKSAHAAHQVVAHHRPLQLAPRILGVRPDEVVWGSLRMCWWERIIRRFLIMGVVTVAIIFWSIPSAFIGIISNIKFLTCLPFLTWIKLLPGAVTGSLQGLLPSIALSFWMSLAPAMLRFCGLRAGIPSSVLVELFTQDVFFAFQIVQVFLVTTLPSSASATAMAIIEEPLKAPDILAGNLPKASNFYLSYILVQCLAIGATGLLHASELIRHYGFARLTQIPRARFNIWYQLQPPKWGGVYPIYTNMAAIALCYTCIAPLILVFACAGMEFVRIIYRYNILYVFDSEMDSLGLFYPNALIHLIVGLYLAEACMIGFFSLQHAFPPMVVMLVFLVITGLVHLSLRDSISPLLANLPQALWLEEELQREEKVAAEARLQEAVETGQASTGSAASYFDAGQNFGAGKTGGAPSEDKESHAHEGLQSSRAVEGVGGLKLLATEWIKSVAKGKLKAEAEEAEEGPVMKFLNKWFLVSRNEPSEFGQPPTFVKRFVHPEIYEDFIALRKLIHVEDQPEFDYEMDEKLSSYWPPELWRPKPVLWIPRDDARVSRQEVAHTRKITPITDVGVGLNDRGLIVVDVEAAPFPRLRLLH